MITTAKQDLPDFTSFNKEVKDNLKHYGMMNSEETQIEWGLMRQTYDAGVCEKLYGPLTDQGFELTRVIGVNDFSPRLVMQRKTVEKESNLETFDPTNIY